ncbi:MAG: CDP-diacylglycerol--glycerol-3-phosphate 3-phosphatidyltransferase [Tenericutes bacterium]|nr:CDP-diacylglycerol--glycerol-3-phosphate 3-phosphatidyltransferase [Mycoplasmatota bacterium]
MKKIKFNLPTKLTFVRLILSLIIIILLIFPFYRVGVNFPQFLFKNILIDLRYLISGVLFIIASITDYYDGKLARKNNEVTNFGKLVDAIADKVLVNSVLIIFACQGFISAVVPVVIIVRDIIVDAIRMICANNGKVQAAKLSGKIKTATLMIGVILTFFYNLPFQIWGYRVSDFFLYFGTIMSVVSMFEYYNLNKKIIFQEFEEK